MTKSSDEYLLLDKSNLRVLTINDVSIPLPDLKNIFESKAVAISNWLVQWLEKDYKSGKIKETDLLPKKPELAYHLGVSTGTMQNALRYLEDKGYVESKQCIGTMVRNWSKPASAVKKLTSKRDVSVDLIKKFIVEKNIKIGQKLPSSRAIANVIGASANTTRLALEYLAAEGIIEHNMRFSNEASWVLKSADLKFSESNITENKTLVDKVEKELEIYITNNMHVGDKLPAHDKLSFELKVSVKTIHDSLKALIDKGILLPRRGRYGTTVVRMPNEMAVSPKKETSIFASAQDTAFYNYEKTQNHIKQLIAQKYDIGSKLPSILELSKEMDLSPNTVRKALKNLSKEGYLMFSRGRYGGTFIIDIPEVSTQSFKWLAVNPKYVKAYKEVAVN